MNNIKITIKKELRTILRDKKSLMMMILTPILIPIYILLFSYIYEKMIDDSLKKEYKVGINYELNDIEKDITEKISLKTETHNIEELKELYEKKEISIYIIKENNKYNIYYNPKNTDSITIFSLVNTYLEQYNTYLGQKYLTENNIDIEKVYENIKINTYTLKGNNDLADILLSTGFVFSMMSIFLSATYGATDSTAGEKERGTLETILTFPIKSKELILGKYFAITISCIITSIISTIMVLASIIIAKNSFTIFNELELNINIVSTLAILIIMISYSLFVSGICIAITSFSKTYKEAQSTLTPISFVTMIPMFLDILKVKINIPFCFIPMVSHNMIINNILTNGTTENIIYIILSFLITLIYSVITINIIGKMYKSEKVLFSI